MQSQGRLQIRSLLLISMVLAPSVALTQDAAPPSLQEQLSAQYTMVKMGADSNGPAMIEAGTILAIQKGGILGVPYNQTAVFAAKYQGGQMHPPSVGASNSATNAGKKLCGLFGKCNAAQDQVNKQATTKFFQVGDKVYPSKLEVKPDKDSVVLSVIACDSCNNVNPATYYKSEVVFQFDKGYLAKASPPDIEDVIAQVFQLSDNNSQNSGNGDQGQNNQGQNNQAQGGGQQGGGQQQQNGQGQQGGGNDQTQTIQMGQTTDQVVASMGQPQKIVNLGPKQIYVYKDLKITFLNGRVADVQ